MASKAIIPILVGGMLATGVCNTLLSKYQDIQCVRNCDESDSKLHKTFEQPVIQTVQMFIGEMGCWLVVLGFKLYKSYIAKSQDAPLLYQPVNTDENGDEDATLTSQENATPGLKALVPNADDRIPLEGWKVFLLALPSCCDITGTTLMNVGLLYVAASIYQMTRGALILFVGLFSVWFLKRKLYPYHWFSLFTVVAGVTLVGVAGSIFSGDKNAHTPPEDKVGLVRNSIILAREVAPEVLHTIAGILLVAFAQIFTATQFVLEEWILEHYALEPIKVVSWEGTFGLLVTLIAQVILHFTVGTSKHGKYGYFDAGEGYREMFTNRAIAVSSFLIMLSIGGFNFFGLSVTRSISATSRSIIDTCRTVFIWIISLALGWESFKWLQIIGFAMLVYGTFMFNDLVRPPLKACMPQGQERRRRGSLLEEEPIEHR